MKTFFTLLATIMSLSAYTIVGVHANCAICPKAVGGAGFNSRCTQSNGDITRCRCVFLIPVILFDPGGTYRQNRYLIKKGGASYWCFYDQNGNSDSDRSSNLCPSRVGTGSQCPGSC
ncbi:hypothetical protein PAXRUDRAFT_167493 [Paxillus rubicundulus Ve08.2h10]|uniref:Secreted protein n=1 Tax=Paxillus rubicundulus Ve08.2h10 TaxID=930991 RepID=A0A0D0CPH7_9AGAM|nr:hypothetical protein PAXRUDRAFT_177324 [Paxillus rubicundulus Ve08.2h10]KIK77213.1 hypothetical protein PAXRUDRAFT_167493 [Paxillus rubicundulus Ve08.2h10]